MSAEAIIFTGVVVYLIMMLAVGVVAAKKADSAENFMVTGRRMPIWICTAIYLNIS
ncbi:MAG: hypothetical protein HON77_23335 [Gammaproteobacteria bacterium]|nr:hypothetical protein [Gammaproteobacteria bacterium]MBT5153366.1 hypothetical protein [Gammaproteobacteria bacterium]MBT5686617.1 hypothetical protein [Gammaproteobacteria bacterium]MBT5724173.1 hypothetical protein [Gammaproteobacteria bacterium]MBT6587238.1 hypothetical protein [Gammaproteobacteria bacterium]